MFSLICDSCAARLKVLQASAVNQVLACPKCGSMIRVVPPADWVAPQIPSPSQSDVDISRSSSAVLDTPKSDFEDVDHVLSPAPSKGATAQRPPITAGPPKRPNSPPTKRPAPSPVFARPQDSSKVTFQLAPPVESVDSSDVLPANWTNPKTKRKQLWLIGVISTIGFLCLVVTAITVFSNQTPKPGLIAKSPEEMPVEPVATPPDERPAVSPDGSQAVNSAPPTDSTTKPVSNPDTSADSKPDNHGKTDKSNDTEKPVDAIPLTTEGRVPEKSGSESPLSSSSSPIASPDQSTNLDAAVAPKVSADGSIRDSLGELSSLLQNYGSSLTEIGDIAEAQRMDRLVNLPKFYVPKPTVDSSLTPSWDTPVANVEYYGVPLNSLLRELTQLSGYVVNLDVQALSAEGVFAGTPVDVKLSDTTLAGILEEVLARLDLEQIEENGVVTVRPKNSTAVSSRNFALPNLPESTVEKFQHFATSLPYLVAPRSWPAAPDIPNITIVGDQLVINQIGLIHNSIGQFIVKLNAGFVLNARPEDAAARAELTSRWSRATESLNKPISLKPSLDQPIEAFFDSIQREQGVVISVDWLSLMSEGWTPVTKIPGNVSAETIGELLREISRSLEATVVAVDAKTFKLTSFYSAAESMELELYPIREIVAGPVKAPQILEIIEQALGAQLRSNPDLRLVIEPECNCLIVVAPQSIQRQVEVILDRLRQLKN